MGLVLTYLAVGTALLYALGLVRSRRSLALHAGLALVAGWALTGAVAAYALVLGGAGAPGSVLPLLAAACAVAVAAGRRVPAAPEPRAPAETPAGRALAVGTGVLLAVYLALHLGRALVAGANWWDAWAFWLPKARSIYHFGGLDVGPGGFASFANPNYPPLVPALDALGFHLFRSATVVPLPALGWAVAAGSLAALAVLLLPRVRPAVLWPCLLSLALLPNFGRLVGAMTGDQPVALAVMLGGVCAVLWRLGESRPHAVLAGVFLAAAALIKDEGLYMSLLLVGLLVLADPRRRVAWPRLAALALVPVAALLPWRAWLSLADVVYATNYRPVDAARPAYLLDRLDRLGIALAELPAYFLDPGLWLLAVPVAAAAALVALRAAPLPARIVLAMLPLAYLGLAGLYWISSPGVRTLMGVSAPRVLAPTMYLVTALVPLLLGAVLARDREAST